MNHLNIGTLENKKPFTLPEEALVETFFFGGIRGSGKTTAVAVMCEEFCRVGLPWIMLDPVSVGWGLRAGKDGSPNGGLPVVVFGGQHGDLPLDKAQGAKIAEVLVESNICAVIDLKLESKTTWRKFITDFALKLLEITPKTPRHIFIEEAGELLPQKAKFNVTAQCKEAVERLVRLGRNQGYGCSLVNQRPATIDKDVLSVAPWMRSPVQMPNRGGMEVGLRTMEEIWNHAANQGTHQQFEKYECIELHEKARLKTLCFKNGMGQWAPIRKVIRHHYKGSLIRLCQKWGEIVVTPNHSVYAADGSLARPQDNPELLAVRTVNQQHARDTAKVTLQLPDSNYVIDGNVFKFRHHVPNGKPWTMRREYKGKNLKALLSVMGAYISEGSVHWVNQSKKHPESRGNAVVQIANTDRPWLQRIMADLKTFAQPATHIYEGGKSKLRTMPCWNLTTNNKPFAAWLEKNCGKGSDHKRLPEFVFGLQWEYVEVLLDALIKGDGSRYSNGSWAYFTKSQELAQGLGLLLSMHGKGYVVSKDEKTGVYRIHHCDWYNHRDAEIHKMEEVPFDGYVYDLEIDDRYAHNFVIGVGNVVVHNSQVGNLILLRTIGKHDRKACMEWLEPKFDEIDVQNASESFPSNPKELKASANKLINSLAALPDGCGYFWSPSWLHSFEKIQFRDRGTFHPGATRRDMRGGLKSVKLMPVAKFVQQMKGLLSRKQVAVDSVPRMDPAEAREFKKAANEFFRPSAHPEIDHMEIQNQKLVEAQAEIAKLTTERDDARLHAAATGSKIARARAALEPLYTSLKDFFEESVDAGGNGETEQASVSNTGFGTWLLKAGSRRRALQHLLDNGPMTQQQLITLCNITSETWRNWRFWFQTNSLIRIDGRGSKAIVNLVSRPS